MRNQSVTVGGGGGGGTMVIKHRRHLRFPRMDSLILGANATETEKLRVGDSAFARGRMGGNVVQIRQWQC